jgi:protein subunit release factor B
MTNARHPPPYSVDERSLAATTRMEIYTGGGPGGQHRNKTQNAVRLHHEPSGVTVTATERRSLEANKEAAFERLRERLVRLNHVPKKRKATRPTRGSVERRLTQKTTTSRKKTERRRRDDD